MSVVMYFNQTYSVQLFTYINKYIKVQFIILYYNNEKNKILNIELNNLFLTDILVYYPLVIFENLYLNLNTNDKKK